MDQQSEENKPLLTPTLPRWWRVIPTLTLMMIIGTIDGLILNDLIEYRYATHYQVNSSSSDTTREICLNDSRIAGNSSSLVSTTTSRYPVSTTISPNDRVQIATARLNVFISLASTIPGIITAILLGANCDIIGRKPLLILPYVGKILRYFILTAVVYFNMSDLWIIVAVMLDSAFGTGGLNILSSFAYVTDCTNEKTRTLAITITDVCIGCSRCIPLITMGLYLEHPRFVQSMIFTFVLSVAGFVYSIALQPESNLNVQHLNIFQQLGKTRLLPVTKIFRVFLVKREGHKQRSLLLLVASHVLVIVMICGPLAMYYTYLYGAPFCMDSFGVSLVNVAQSVLVVILTIPFTLTLAERTDHLVLPVLGCFSYITQLVLFGIAKTVWMLYIATCSGALFSVLIPVVRSRITKLVEPDEYACVFILTMIVETGGYFAISAMANEIYQVSITYFPGLVYFVFAMVGVIAILLLTILYIVEYRSPVVKKKVTINE